MKTLTGLMALAALGCTSSAAVAAAYPERPIIFILPVSAGGATDVGARTYAPHIAQCLGDGSQIVVTNMPGGSSVVGISAVAASPADGYTFGTLNMPNLVTTTIVAERTYTPESFVFLGNVVGSTSAFSVQKGSDITSLKDIVDRVKGGGTVRVGVGTMGSDDHLAFLRFAKLAGIEMNYVPFGDEARARNALLGGNVDVIGMSATAALGFANEITVIGAASPERLSYAPDVPTFVEQGYDLVSGSMHALGMPAGVPDDIVAKMRGCVDSLATNDAFLKEAAERGVALKLMNADAVAAAIAEEATVLEAIWEETPWAAK